MSDIRQIRDIRHDLKDRLKLIDQERGKLQERFQALDVREKFIRGLLEDEEAHWPNSRPSIRQPTGQRARSGNGRTALGAFIHKTMADGQPWSLERLKEAARVARIEFGEKAPGRVLHYALVGMGNKGYVEMIGASVWRLIKRNASPGSPDEALEGQVAERFNAPELESGER